MIKGYKYPKKFYIREVDSALTVKGGKVWSNSKRYALKR
jgi:hypothetical protein